MISLDDLDPEARYSLEPTDNLSADKAYDRTWALTLLEKTRARLREEFRDVGKGERFEVLEQFLPGESAESLCLTGFETYDIPGIAAGLKPGQRLSIVVKEAGGKTRTIETICRIDTPYEMQYYQHGGILQFVLRQLL